MSFDCVRRRLTWLCLGSLVLSLWGCTAGSEFTVELTSSLARRGISLKNWKIENETLKIELAATANAKLPGSNEGWFSIGYDPDGNSFGREVRLPAFNLQRGTTGWFEIAAPELDRTGKLILDVHDSRYVD